MYSDWVPYQLIGGWHVLQPCMKGTGSTRAWISSSVLKDRFDIHSFLTENAVKPNAFWKTVNIIAILKYFVESKTSSALGNIK